MFLLLAAFLIGVIVGASGAALLGAFRNASRPLPLDDEKAALVKERHTHEYDHMRGDGLWRCRVCDKPKSRDS